MKREMHAHTREVSPCAGVPAETLVREYAGAGYSAVVITDHFNYYVLEGFGLENTRDRVNRYLLGFEEASKAASKYGMKAILGTEVCLRNVGCEDYLLYGIEPEVLQTNPYMYDYTLAQLREMCDKNGILLFQAHPFRGYLKRADINMLDGIEVHNGCPRHDSHNDMALEWAVRHGKLMSSGSDYHQTEDLARGGIISDILPENSKELKQLLISGNYTVIK